MALRAGLCGLAGGHFSDVGVLCGRLRLPVSTFHGVDRLIDVSWRVFSSRHAYTELLPSRIVTTICSICTFAQFLGDSL